MGVGTFICAGKDRVSYNRGREPPPFQGMTPEAGAFLGARGLEDDDPRFDRLDNFGMNTGARDVANFHMKGAEFASTPQSGCRSRALDPNSRAK